MSRRHADNWSHYLVDPYTWPYSHQMVTVMVMNDLLPHPLCNVNRPSHSEIQLFQNLTMKIHGQGHVCGQRSRSRLNFKQISKVKIMVKVKPIGHIWGLEFNLYICFSFRGNRTIFGWDIYSKFHIWPWKFKVKIMAKVKPDVSHLSPRVQSICLLFVSWQSDHFWLRYSKFHIWPWEI